MIKTPIKWEKARTVRHLKDATGNSFGQISMPAKADYDNIADEIEHAVNMHSELVKALEATVFCEENTGCHGCPIKEKCGDGLDSVEYTKAVLAKAKEK